MEIFSLAEVAKIVGMPTDRAKDWTVGKPFEIKPSIRAAEGKGSRKLFSVEDVYLMAFVNEMWTCSVNSKAIKRVLDRVGRVSDLFGEKELTGLILHLRSRDKTEVEKVYRNTITVSLDSDNGLDIVHIVKIVGIRARIDSRLRMFKEGSLSG
jgi:hypothetical protein